MADIIVSARKDDPRQYPPSEILDKRSPREIKDWMDMNPLNIINRRARVKRSDKHYGGCNNKN